MAVRQDRRQIFFTVARTAGMLWLALFLILVVFPVALAAQTP